LFNSTPPFLTSWRYHDSLPEIQLDFADAEYTSANHTSTNANIPPTNGSVVLSATDYGFVTGKKSPSPLPTSLSPLGPSLPTPPTFSPLFKITWVWMRIPVSFRQKGFQTPAKRFIRAETSLFSFPFLSLLLSQLSTTLARTTEASPPSPSSVLHPSLSPPGKSKATEEAKATSPIEFEDFSTR